MDVARNRILIVEDDKGLGELVRRTLKREGYETVLCSNKSQTIEFLRDDSADLMLLDYKLPDATGEEVLDEIQDLEVTIPYIVTTGFGCEKLAVDLMKRGALDYIVKESNFCELIPTTVHRVMEKINIEKRLHDAEILVDKEAKFKKVLFNSLPCYAGLVNSSGRVIGQNNKAEMQGIFANPKYYPLWNVTDGTTKNCVQQVLKDKKEQQFDYELDENWFNVHLIPAEGNQCLVYIFDITNKKIMESERYELERQFQQMQKMDAIGQLTGGITHDFNNLLTIMGTSCELAQMFTDPEAKTQEHLKIIFNTVEQAKKLTSQLLAFSRRTESELRETNIHELIYDTVNLLKTGNKMVKIEMDLEASPNQVMAEPTLLQNAFLNLGINAFDAMPSGGTLKFITEVCSPEEGQVKTVTGKGAPKTHLRVKVQDTGSGMDEKTRQRIFEPFFTTKGPGKGTGLGLAGVYGCIKNHNGVIEVDSVIGEGTTFSILLPLPAEVAGDVSQQEEVGQIMVVDDEPLVRELLVNLLRGLDHDVICFEDGLEAIDYYRENQKDVKLVLLDLMMPRIDGTDTFKRLKEFDKNVKAIMITGYGKVNDIDGLYEEGLLGYIHKPFNGEEFITNITAALMQEK
jgi:signal transduction histidine kinase/DNA-binding response OmpR family regulator